jgi:hypothetical protein
MPLNLSKYSEVNTAYEKEATFLWIYLFAVSGIIFSTPLVLRQYFRISNLYPWVKFVIKSKLSHIDFYVIQHYSEIIFV